MSDTDELISTIFSAKNLSYAIEKVGGRSLDGRSILSTTLRAELGGHVRYFYIRDVGIEVVQLEVHKSDHELGFTGRSYSVIFNAKERVVDCVDVIYRHFHNDPYQERIFHGLNILFRDMICEIEISEEAPTFFEIRMRYI